MEQVTLSTGASIARAHLQAGDGRLAGCQRDAEGGGLGLRNALLGIVLRRGGLQPGIAVSRSAVCKCLIQRIQQCCSDSTVCQPRVGVPKLHELLTPKRMASIAMNREAQK